MGFEAIGTISRTAYGVSFGVPMISDAVGLNLNVQFVLPAAADVSPEAVVDLLRPPISRAQKIWKIYVFLLDLEDLCSG